MTRDIRVNSGASAYIQNITIGSHHLFADEPAEAGGADAGPNPYELVMAALGACTSMTARIYAERKNWPLEKVLVELTFSRIHAADCDDCGRNEGIVDRIEEKITFIGDLSETQRQRLLQVAKNCPVHRLLAGTVEIVTVLNAGSISAESPQI